MKPALNCIVCVCLNGHCVPMVNCHTVNKLLIALCCLNLPCQCHMEPMNLRTNESMHQWKTMVRPRRDSRYHAKPGNPNYAYGIKSDCGKVCHAIHLPPLPPPPLSLLITCTCPCS